MGLIVFLLKKTWNITLLVEGTDMVGDWFFGPNNVNNPERQKFMKTVRNFLNFILTK